MEHYLVAFDFFGAVLADLIVGFPFAGGTGFGAGEVLSDFIFWPILYASLRIFRRDIISFRGNTSFSNAFMNSSSVWKDWANTADIAVLPILIC